jgi:hypothetical protein
MEAVNALDFYQFPPVALVSISVQVQSSCYWRESLVAVLREIHRQLNDYTVLLSKFVFTLESVMRIDIPNSFS